MSLLSSIRRSAAMLMCMVAALLSHADTWDQDSITKALSNHELDIIEGVWQFPDDGARLMILRSTAYTYNIILLDSPRLDVRPGIVIGKAKITPIPRTYDAVLSNSSSGDKSLRKSTTKLVVTPEGMLRLSPYSQGLSVSFRRWIPYFLRLTFKINDKPDGLEGAVRVYPVEESDYKPCL